MKKLFAQILFFFSVFAFAQETGTIAGALSDKEMNNEPLPFANVSVKNTSKGTTSDFDGLYKIENIPTGTYTIVFSFIGYETVEIPNVKVEANKVTEINTGLGASAAALDEVMITTVSRRDSEVALLLDQKDAVDIKESIGSQELTKLGVSDAATATTKISGVSSSEASGDVFVRGLGDRYLYTTLNGMPIPSDDIERKNIDLSLFPTRIVQSVSISKTYSSANSADQSSGSVDISSRSLVGLEEFGFGTQVGLNTNANAKGIGSNFKRTANESDLSLGFYSKDISTRDAITDQTWNAQSTNMPINYQYSLTAGKKIGEKFKIFFTGSQSSKFEYSEGIFRQFERNRTDVEFTDASLYNNTINTTGLLDLKYRFDKKNEIKALSLFVNKVKDEVYEAGRNREGFVFEEVNNEDQYSQFIRDQNTKQTRLWVNQLLGDHEIGEKNHLTWGLGYNKLNADEPNRIRNEVNIKKPTDMEGELVELGFQGGFQQRKTSQILEDLEYNARLKNEFTVFENDSISTLKLSLGGNYRNKTRDFTSSFFGVTENGAGVNPPSIDHLDAVFTTENFNNDLLDLRLVRSDSEGNIIPDTYDAELNSSAGFFNINYSFSQFNFNVGARYQKDMINLDYDVANAPGGQGGNVEKNYDNFYPALNIKYAVSEKHNLRLAASKTITLPEFKEIAPFEYVSATGQITRGNVDLEASNVYNLDLKWEFFPTNKELISATAFYKNIKDPINRVLDRGSAGVFSFFNSGEEATIYGIELDANVNLTSSEEENGINLDLGVNFSRMWHNQDLKTNFNDDGTLARTFQYNNKTEVGLQGASDYIVNTSLNFSTNWEREFNANISGNYASDKIFALGSAPDSQTDANSVLYNNEIIEEGFVTLNATLSQELSERLLLRFKAQNILNPEIKRTQDVLPLSGGVQTENNQTTRSYTRGAVFTLGINYNF